jgi:hypothetical protein
LYTAVFVNPRKTDVDMIMVIMQRFGEATGLWINISKSSVAPIRCSELSQDDILQNFQGAQVSFPVNYLGLPITSGRLRLSHLQLIFDQAAGKLAGWQGNLLNIGGCRELVKTVLSSLPMYLLTAIKPPKKFYKEMDKIQRKFLWAGSDRFHGGKCKVNGSLVCRQLNRGGIGLTDLERFGRALRLRWLWFQWKTPNKPWCNMELPIDNTDEALFTAATKVTVHNGCWARFWTSSLINGRSPAALFPALFNHSKRKKRSVANGTWIEDVLHDTTPALFAEYFTLWHLIQEIGFNPADREEDEIVRSRTANGQYSASSAYKMQFEGGTESLFPAGIWQIWAPARCKLFMWLMIQNRIWTADMLLRREWTNHYFCPLCYRNLETVGHLFMECPVARQVWIEVSN